MFPEPYEPPELPGGRLDPDRPTLVERGLAVLPEDGEGCDDAPVAVGVQVFGGVPPYRYRWDESPDLADPTAARTVARGRGNQDFFVTVTDAAGEQVRTRVTVSRLPLPTPAIGFALGSREVCAGSPVVLDGSASRSADGSPPAAFSWDLDGDGLEDESAPATAEWIPVDGQPVRLTVTDTNGCTASAGVTLGSRPLPIPAVTFLAGDERSCAGEAVALDASSSVDADGLPVADYAWDLDGDGAIDSRLPSPGPFVPAATATATLTVADAFGCEASAAQPLAVLERPQPVIAFAAGGDLLCQGEPLVLDGSLSRDANGEPVRTFAWDLDGDPATVESTAALPPPLVPATSRAVTLTVTDGNGCSASASRPVAVRPVPTAAITFAAGDGLSCAGETVALSAAASRDADGNLPAGLTWDLDGDGSADAVGPNPPPFAPAESGTARLVVEDALGCTAAATQDLVVRAPPVPRIAFTAGAAAVCGGDEVGLDASSSRDADGNPVASFAWDLDGDGRPDRTGAATGSFVPASSGAATLAVEDAHGCRATLVQPFIVRAPPAAAVEVIGPGKLCDGDLVQFDGSASRDAAGGPVASYAWDRNGDGIPDETAAITAPFAPAGGVQLTVADADACRATAVRTVPVLGPRQLYPFASTPGTGNGVVDIIFVIDNSGSMGDEIEAVENNINVNFADIIQASQIDYRIILISKHGRSSQEAICVRSPLSGTDCTPKPPNRPANTSRFFHYDAEVGSWNSLQLILSTFRQPDPHGLAPNGWSGWLRPDARRVFVEITDDESALSANDFEAALFALSPADFGSAQDRKYVFHGIVGLAKNSPATEAWGPQAPLQIARCGAGSMAPGIQYQELSRRTGGLRFPICEYASFDAVFEAIAGEVIEDVLACELALPAAAPAPETLEVEYTPGDGSGIRVLERVANAGSCTGAGGFYLDGGTVRLCPAACAEVQADPGAGLFLSGCGP